jgi:hypothetical protein
MLRINNNETVNIKYLTSDMSNNKQRYAISLAADALDKYYNSKSYGDMAEYIKDEFETKYGKYWCCFVFDAQTGFGSYFTKLNNYYIHFVLRNVNFVLFKQVG